MPGRPGPRFAIEALFLIALAVGAAFADLETKWILLVMAAGWLVVALLELTSERIWASAPPWRRPYYAPAPPPPLESERPLEPEPDRQPEPEPATVIDATLDEGAVTVHAAPAPEAAPAARPPEPSGLPEPEPVAPPLESRTKRSWFRRRERLEPVVPPEPGPPKHVRLLPTTSEGSRVAEEVAEIFDAPERDGQSR